MTVELEVVMLMSTIVIITFVLAIFAVFAAALAYGQLVTRGIVAPGAVRP